MPVTVIDTVAGMAAQAPRRPRATVMTMGALHAGHEALIDEARAFVGTAGEVVVTVFVNPLQFGPGEDYERYPRTWEHDLLTCEHHDVDFVFAPTAEDMYSAGRDVTVDPGPLGEILEGAVRPGHFRGMLTVVAKLLHLTRPDVAYFGEKDYQQLVLIQAMVATLNVPTVVVGVPTVRAEDGLALSSRNAYLSGEERVAAGVIPMALDAGVSAAMRGQSAAAVVAAVQEVLATEAQLTPEYVVVTAPDLGPAPERGFARLLLAVKAGSRRLIDNAPVLLGPT